MSDSSILDRAAITDTFRDAGPVRSYRARTSDGLDVSIKVVEASPQDAEEALDTIDRLVGVDSPRLARVLEHGLAEGGYYVVREWVTGTHLGTRPLPVQLTRDKLVAAVADGLDGLAALHGAGLVHGDVRPSNFVVADDGSVKLVDPLVPAVSATDPGAPARDAYFTSPEELEGGAATAATDIYRTGLVLYEVLTGKPVFDGADASEVAEAHLAAVPPAPSASAPGLAAGLDAVVSTALAKNADSRFPSAAGMAMAIRQTATKPKSRLWVWILAASLAVLLLLGGGLAWWFTRVPNVAVPQIVGLPRSEANAALLKAGFKTGAVSVVESISVAPDTVTSQVPSAGAEVPEGSSIAYSVSAVPQATTPDVTGQELDEATALLAQNGLRVGAVNYGVDSKAKPGTVTSQNPPAAEQVDVGTPVALVVSAGPKLGQVPDVVGLSQADAEAALEGAGFKHSAAKASSTQVAAGDVISQSPSAKSASATGSVVALKVSKGAPAAPKVTVPNVVGLGVIECVRSLAGAGLKIGFAFVADAANALKVVAQTPAATTQVEPGTRVTVSIGLPPWIIGATPTPLPAPVPTSTPTPNVTVTPVPVPVPTTTPAPTLPPTPPATTTP